MLSNNLSKAGIFSRPFLPVFAGCLDRPSHLAVNFACFCGLSGPAKMNLPFLDEIDSGMYILSMNWWGYMLFLCAL